MDEDTQLELEEQIDQIKMAIRDGRAVSVAYDNGCATFIIEFDDGKYEQQQEICGNDLVYALAYALGVDDFFSA